VTPYSILPKAKQLAFCTCPLIIKKYSVETEYFLIIVDQVRTNWSSLVAKYISWEKPVKEAAIA
jgi:hypothetical protein